MRSKIVVSKGNYRARFVYLPNETFKREVKVKMVKNAESKRTLGTYLNLD